ncbi:MAG: uracil-DNA glycosylase [Rhodospirillales bacterium]
MAGPTESQAVLTPENAAAALRWLAAAGVDVTVEDAPQNRFTAPKPKPEARAAGAAAQGAALRTRGPSKPAEPAKPAPPEGAAAAGEAVRLAKAAKTLDDLRRALEGFEGCPLKNTATSMVFGEGSADARVMFIGEAPGAEEDRRGAPFVGASGQLLNKMLESISLARADVFISNTVFWRPPGNRTPTAAETAVCQPFVERLAELVDPQALVLLGGAAAKSMLGRAESVGHMRGRWMEYGSAGLSHPVPAMVMYHPAYLLRTTSAKRHAWRDMLMLKDKLAGPEAGAGTG